MPNAQRDLKLARVTRNFDALMLLASSWLKRNNPCDIRRTQDGVVCVACRKHPEHDRKVISSWRPKPNSLCCGGCKYHSDTGCTATDPLNCRTWLCDHAQANSADLGEFMQSLRDMIAKHGFYGFRADRDQIIESGMLTIATPVDHYLLQYARQTLHARTLKVG